MRKFFPSNIFIPTDGSAEAANLIKSYQNRRSSNFVWYRELGKDLIKFIDRPNFIVEVLDQLSSIYIGFMAAANAEFVEALSLDQIKNLIQDKQGYSMIDIVQIRLNTDNSSYTIPIPLDVNKLRQLYLKIERIRIPIIVNDPRPYVGEMVGSEEDRGIDPSIAFGRIKDSLRFGGTHDGEHWLTKNIGAQVRATAGIKGIALTYYY